MIKYLSGAELNTRENLSATTFPIAAANAGLVLLIVESMWSVTNA